MDAKTIYLKDYRPSTFLIETIDLDVDIQVGKTLVGSKLLIKKNHDSLKASLELNGENLKLLEVKLNGEVLSSSAYQLSGEKLVILNLELNEFTLETLVEIHPESNKSAEGFYQSGNQFCTQCEPEGFRKITYYIDRPDVMAKFSTRMSADKIKFPHLLSNGNRTESGDLPAGRHWVKWVDPFKKPAYLFAMVAGDFDVARDSFTTYKNRKVDLEIYVDKGNLPKTPHAMNSLKHSMKWDEETFGLEYDLDIYMIVAVDSFNMGAMENKGLNIFNSTYTLADQKSATDIDFQNIQGVIGHEYFHNWTGNRITCRDWFQLTLKEGLTVYRDQEFSSDMLSRAVKRLEDVRMLKDRQFSEDAGPLSHPIRPSSYMEINNFYTATIYEKGSEVIRMIATLIGKENFRKGMDKYFELYDGMAVTTEDFVHAMELASGKDLAQFRNWYSRPGTPTLKISSKIDGGELVLDIKQEYPPTTLKVPEGNVLHMPFEVGFIYENEEVEKTLEIKALQESFRFPVTKRPILSLNRGFSAPVIVEYEYDQKDLYTLMALDQDPYCRFEATQKVYNSIFKAEFSHYMTSGKLKEDLPDEFILALNKLLNDSAIDRSFKSYLLDLPTENGLSQEMSSPDFELIHLIRKHVKKKIGTKFQDWFIQEHAKLSKASKFELTPEAFGARSLKNQSLGYLVASGTQTGVEILQKHYKDASNMTEEMQGLSLYVMTGANLDHQAIRGFYSKWQHDSLVMLKWFGTLAAYTHKSEAIKRLEALEKDPLFKKDVPNFLRALYMQFAKNNLNAFHAVDGSGYHFIAERVKLIDSFNPQVASRLASSFSMINKVDGNRKTKMKEALEIILKAKPSRDTYEVISKYLEQ